MKNAIKLITPVVLMLLFAMSSNAQTSSTKVKEGKKCDPKACEGKVCDLKNCDPKLYSVLMPQCCKASKTATTETPDSDTNKLTRVASASTERAPIDFAKKPACASGQAKKCCAKKGN